MRAGHGQVALLQGSSLGCGVIEAAAEVAIAAAQSVPVQVKGALVEVSRVIELIAGVERAAHVGEGELYRAGEVDILDSAAVAAHVLHVPVQGVDVPAAIVAFTGPELPVGMFGDQVAAADEGLLEVEGVGGVALKGLAGEGADQDLGMEPGMILGLAGIDPVVDEDKFAVGVRFVAEAVVARGTGRLEVDLLAALAVDTDARAQVAVKLEGLGLLLDRVLLVVQVFVDGSLAALGSLLRAGLLLAGAMLRIVLAARAGRLHGVGLVRVLVERGGACVGLRALAFLVLLVGTGLLAGAVLRSGGRCRQGAAGGGWLPGLRGAGGRSRRHGAATRRLFPGLERIEALLEQPHLLLVALPHLVHLLAQHPDLVRASVGRGVRCRTAGGGLCGCGAIQKRKGETGEAAPEEEREERFHATSGARNS
jgi:hypothetical protein